MNNSQTAIDRWLTEPAEIDDSLDNTWEPGFDANRQIVLSQFGYYKKVFLCPDKFIKRFYHTIYPLPIEKWQCTEQIKLYDGFCTLELILEVNFQATHRYAGNHLEILPELNQHIKETYQGLTINLVKKELARLTDGKWVQEGLKAVENKISLAVSQMLLIQNIQSMVICHLHPSFEGFPNVTLSKENVYLCVLKKSFEFDEQKEEELFRQRQIEEKQKTKQQQEQLIELDERLEIKCQKQALQAENNKRLLLDEEQQKLAQCTISKRIHVNKVKHNIELKRITLSTEIKEKKSHQTQLREQEEQNKIDLIAHQMKLKEMEQKAEIADYEKQQTSWREAKNKIHLEELNLKNRQKQLELDAELDYKKWYERQHLTIQEENSVARKKSADHLKREIDLLTLEKQKLDLQFSIKNYQETTPPKNNQAEADDRFREQETEGRE